MILGLGTDIVEIGRISALLERHGSHFTERVYTADETAQANGRINYLAGRWAAKEAAAKALGCGIGEKCALTDIEIIDGADGAPRLSCIAPALEGMGNRNVRWHVSISHESAYAVATVILEGGAE